MVTLDQIKRVITKIVAPLHRRIMLQVRLGKVISVNDGDKTQRLQVKMSTGELLDLVRSLLPYGFTHFPHKNSEGLFVSPGGNSGHTIAVSIGGREYRLKSLKEGEVSLFDDIGQVVHLTRTGIMVGSPKNIYLKTDGILRLEGEGVEIYGRSYIQRDVHGKGYRETWTGNINYHTDTYANVHVATSTEHGLSQDVIPSDHPEAQS